MSERRSAGWIFSASGDALELKAVDGNIVVTIRKGLFDVTFVVDRDDVDNVDGMWQIAVEAVRQQWSDEND